MTKDILRSRMLVTLNNMSNMEHQTKSLEITRKVLSSDEFQSASTIGITISRYPEVDTRALIEAAWKTGKRVAVPKCLHATREMNFRCISTFNSLETVYVNLLEPIIDETVSVGKHEIDLQIVPGVIFSDEGYRIGFGGGYYDRYMSDFKGDTLSLAFLCQTGQEVPVESHDVPVNKIFTEKKVIICRNGGDRE